MSKHLGAIQALPEKCVVLKERETIIIKPQLVILSSFAVDGAGAFTHREYIDQVPAELLCQETRNATALHYLRELGRVAKGVWQPELRNTDKRSLQCADNYKVDTNVLDMS